ncbi:hypothetical protein ABN51_23800 [Salmonella enterica subsp. enterica serovar Infantis]|nr:hypothetical protein [Salmonella enterica subsp. enterica serovar Infantis]
MMSRCSVSMPRMARGYPLPGASVPRPDGHGTGGFSAPVRRRCDFMPSTRLLRNALQAAFANERDILFGLYAGELLWKTASTR